MNVEYRGKMTERMAKKLHEVNVAEMSKATEVKGACIVSGPLCELSHQCSKIKITMVTIDG